MRVLFSLISFCLLIACSNSHLKSLGSGDTPKNSEPGKCYKKISTSQNFVKVDTIINGAQQSYWCLKADDDPLNFQWYEVICEDELNEEFIYNIQSKLVQLGLLSENDTSGMMDSKTKQALEKFQYQQKLPIGEVTLATVKELGL